MFHKISRKTNSLDFSVSNHLLRHNSNDHLRKSLTNSKISVGSRKGDQKSITSQNYSEVTVTKLTKKKNSKLIEDSDSSQLPVLRCIVANDNPFQLMACVLNLKKYNMEVIEAVNGYEAVQKVKKCISDNTEINFILLDLNMPILDGYEACH